MSTLRLSERVGYGLGDTASNLYFQFFNIFLFYYYTDVFGLNPAAIGTMYLLANFWDGVNDPMMGAIADRVQTSMGKYRPFLLWFAVPYGICGYLIFANPPLDGSLKLVYAYSTFIVFKMVYTAINVPYSALMGVMSDDAQARVELSTARFIGAFGGGFLVALLVRPLVAFLGEGNETVGFQWTMGIFGVASVLMFLITFATTKERLAPITESVDLKTDFGLLLRNRPWLVMVAAAVCTLASVALRGAVTVHYFKYFVGYSDEVIFSLGGPSGLNLDATTLFLTSGSIAFIVGVTLTGYVEQMWGRRNGLIVLTLGNGLTVLAFFFLPPTATTAMYALNLLGNLLAGPAPALVWTLYTDVADYGEWRFGRRATGLVFSGAMFAQKMGLTIGGTASGWMLDLGGFVANQAQGPEALFMIRALFSLVPGGLAILNAVVLLAYPLSRAETKAMQEELLQMRAQA